MKKNPTRPEVLNYNNHTLYKSAIKVTNSTWQKHFENEMKTIPRHKKISLVEIGCKVINEFQCCEITFKFADEKEDFFSTPD